MFHPTRGGTRGGQGDFKWEDVAADKDREYYLGHSLRAPVGRWQNGKDLTWYNKEGGADAEARERERQEELKRIKEAEEDALAVALGFAPTPREPTVPATPAIATSVDPNAAVLEKARRKAEKRAEHEARKAERQRIREERAARHRSGRHDREGSARSGGSGHGAKERIGSRSRSPQRRHDVRDEDERDRRLPRSRHEDGHSGPRTHRSQSHTHDTGRYERRTRDGSADRDDGAGRRHPDHFRREERRRSREPEARRDRDVERQPRRYADEEPYVRRGRHIDGTGRKEFGSGSRVKREESSRSPPPSPRRRD